MNATKSVKQTADVSGRETRRDGWRHFRSSMRFSMYTITHPFDGFWDLAHEHKGSLLVAHTWLALFLLTRVLKLMFTSFQFMNVAVQYLNVFEEVFSLLLPFLILCVANWSLTTLFDGKGRFRDIYTAMCYALIPYVLIQLPLVFISNVLTFEEASLYTVLMSFSIVWCVFLAFVGLMEVHDYGPGRTLFFLAFTIVGACVIIFLILVFFSLLSDAYSFFASFYREASYRLN